MRPATTKAQMRLSSNSAPALIFHFIDPKTENNLSTDLEQVTTVPGPTVQAASMVQYSIEANSPMKCRSPDILEAWLTLSARSPGECHSDIVKMFFKIQIYTFAPSMTDAEIN